MVSSLGFDLRAFVPQGLNGNPNYFGFWDNFLNLIICESLKAGGLACVTLAWSSPWKCSTFAKICVVWGWKCLEKRWIHPEIYGILYKLLNWLFNQRILCVAVRSIWGLSLPMGGREDSGDETCSFPVSPQPWAVLNPGNLWGPRWRHGWSQVRLCKHTCCNANAQQYVE